MNAPRLEVLAIIPARGGSKGIPRKNLVMLGGLPLVAHSIAHAKASACVQRVLVSTEDQEIAAVARQHGAEVPFLRPPELAEDHVLDHPVFEHVLRELAAREGYTPSLVVHQRPTTPYRKSIWIDEAVDRLAQAPEADSLRSVSAPSAHPYRVFEIGSDGFLTPIMAHRHPRPYELRRQDLPPMYHYNCVIDVTRPATILEHGSMTGARMLPYLISSDEVVDIDSARDLEHARAVFGKES